MSRSACYWWVRENGYGEPPESSCWHCPYHSNKRWRHIRDSLPGDWEKAVEFDKALRSSEDGLIRVMKNPVFLHSSLVPLSDANIDTQQKSLFDDECSGVCGV